MLAINEWSKPIFVEPHKTCWVQQHMTEAKDIVPALKQFMTQGARSLIWGTEPSLVLKTCAVIRDLPPFSKGAPIGYLDSQSTHLLFSEEWDHATCPVQIGRLLWGSREIIMSLKCFENYKAPQKARLDANPQPHSFVYIHPLLKLFISLP